MMIIIIIIIIMIMYCTVEQRELPIQVTGMGWDGMEWMGTANVTSRKVRLVV